MAYPQFLVFFWTSAASWTTAEPLSDPQGDTASQSHRWNATSFQNFVDSQIKANPYLLGDEGDAPHLAYGEVSLEALDNVWEAIEEEGGSALQDHDVFIDLGSGRGMSVLWAHLATSVGEARGIEISQARHDSATHALRLLQKTNSHVQFFEDPVEGTTRGMDSSNRSVFFQRRDALMDPVEWASNATVVLAYLRNMAETTRSTLTEALRLALPGTLVFTHEKLFGCHRGVSFIRELRFSPMVFTGGSLNMYITSAPGIIPGGDAVWLRQRLSTPWHQPMQASDEICADTGSVLPSLLAAAASRLQQVLARRNSYDITICRSGWRTDMLPLAENIAMHGDATDKWGCLFQWLYWTPTGGRGFMLQKDELETLGAAHTYGEITAEGAEQLLEALPRALTSSDEVVDLGSGTGRFILQLLLSTKVPLLRGIELSRSRHAHAIKALARLNGTEVEADSSYVKRTWDDRQAVFEHADLFNASLQKSTLIYCNTQAFPDLMVWRLGEKLGAELEDDAVASVLGRPLFPCHGVRKIKEVTVPTTWFPGTPVFMYRVMKDEKPASECEAFHDKLLRIEKNRTMGLPKSRSSQTEL